MEAASLWPTDAETPVAWLEASLIWIAVWTWAAVACAWAALSWPVIAEEDAWAAFSSANLFCSLRNSWTLALNSSVKDPDGKNA